MLLQTLIPGQICILSWGLHGCVIWSGYSVWGGWQTADTGVAMGHRLIPGYRASICWAGLHLTPQDQRLIYRLRFCVCMYVYLPMCARVSYVFVRSPRREYVLSAPWSIHQGWHFLPFRVQTKHMATCAISTLRDVERPDLCDLSVRNYAIAPLTHWFGTLPFFIIFPVIGNLVWQTFLSSLPESESWNNKGALTATWPCLLLTPQGRSVGHDRMLF